MKTLTEQQELAIYEMLIAYYGMSRGALIAKCVLFGKGVFEVLFRYWLTYHVFGNDAPINVGLGTLPRYEVENLILVWSKLLVNVLVGKIKGGNK